MWPADVSLFSEMRGCAISENERIFFETMERKELNEYTSAGDLILWELDNEDLIYFVRYNFDEYELGHGKEGCYSEPHYVQCLADALNSNLKDLGCIGEDVTFLEWLRKRDYAGVMYNHNYDLL